MVILQSTMEQRMRGPLAVWQMMSLPGRALGALRGSKKRVHAYACAHRKVRLNSSYSFKHLMRHLPSGQSSQ